MSPMKPRAGTSIVSFPRASGDEPTGVLTAYTQLAFSPRERG